jgi:hypothetical protein
MQLIKKIMGWIDGLNKRPDLSNTWEVSEMSDRVKFMDFILSQASPQDEWQIEMVFTKETLEALRQFGPEGSPIRLSPENVATLRSLLPSFDFGSDFIHHTVTRGDDFLMVSYDNLSCCWVSKRVGSAAIAKASTECGFKYVHKGSA